MNRTEHLLTIIAEEGAEVTQRATKANRFGLSQIQIDSKEPSPNSQNPEERSNEERLFDEVCDLLAVCRMVGLEFDGDEAYARMRAKTDKVERYLDFCRKLGTLS